MVDRGSGTATPHSAGYPTFGTGQVSRDTQQLVVWHLHLVLMRSSQVIHSVADNIH